MSYTKVSTPIVYYGGKTAILPYLMEMVPPHEVYTEVFFGGGTLFWEKHPARNETINDKMDIVINFYRVLRNDFKKLKKHIDASLVGRSIHNEALGIIRGHWKGKKQDKVKLAWAFWLCTNFAYANKIGGGYKYSNDMSVSVPQTMGTRKQSFTELLVARIENAYIENEDALKVLRSRNVVGAFHYQDPPYCGADMGHYAGYQWEQYEELLTFNGEECKGKFMLSNYNSEMLTHFIKKYGWFKREVTHRIKAPRKTGTSKVEVIVTNYASACQTLTLF